MFIKSFFRLLALNFLVLSSLMAGTNALERDEASFFDSIDSNNFKKFELYANLLSFGAAHKIGLQEASGLGRTQMVRHLIEKYSFPENDLGESLRHALEKHKLATSRVLLEHGAPVNYRLEDGRTLLMEAASKNDIKAASLLIEFGATLGNKSDKGWTAHDYAKLGKARNNQELLAILRPSFEYGFWSIAIPVTIVALTVAALYYLPKLAEDRLRSNLGDCSVCQESMKVGDLTKLKCGHHLHKGCFLSMAENIAGQIDAFERWRQSTYSGLEQLRNSQPFLALPEAFQKVFEQFAIADSLEQVGEDIRESYISTLVDGKWKGTRLACPLCRWDPLENADGNAL